MKISLGHQLEEEAVQLGNLKARITETTKVWAGGRGKQLWTVRHLGGLCSEYSFPRPGGSRWGVAAESESGLWGSMLGVAIFI